MKVLLIIMFALIPPIELMAVGSFWNGNGSVTTPFQITTEGDLQHLAFDVNNGKNYDSQYFVLTANLKFWTDWIPIGNSVINSFQGLFNGRGHTISGLNMNDSILDNNGLFGYIKNAKIDSLGIVSASITGKNNVGGIVGIADNSSISNSFVSGKIKGNFNVGGIAGSINNSIILNTYNTANIYGNDVIAGIVGISTQTINNALINCYNIGSINSTKGTIKGGIVGNMSPVVTISSCYYLKATSLLNTNTIGTVKTGAQLKAANFVTILNDISNANTWSIDTELNNGFPILSWQTIGLNIPQIVDFTFTPVKDSTSVLFNPLMNNVKYAGGYDGGYWDFAEWTTRDTTMMKYSRILYIRTPWEILEPTEGNYVWKYNQNFKNLIIGVRAKGFHLAFRVMCQDGGTDSNVAHGTPQYVFDAMKAAGYSNPYSISQPKYPDVTNPVWQAKFKAFILAFGAEFDDPSVTDYVDAVGLGLWGEGNLVGIPTHEQEVAYYDWHLGLYAQAFKHVILDINPGTMGVNPILTDTTIAVKKYGMVIRGDGYGGCAMPNWTMPYVPAVLGPYGRFLIMEACGGGTDAHLLDDAIAEGSNVLNFNTPSFSDPLLVSRMIKHIGYRLRPVGIEIPNQVGVNDIMRINHVWTNDGAGILPNDNIRWQNKYLISFAIFKIGDTTPTKVYLDSNTNPGVLIKGINTSYTTNIQWNVPAGNYQLAVGIIDQTRPTALSLDLAINATRISGWYVMGNFTVNNTNTGIKEVNSQLDKITLSPNPANSKLTIKGVTGHYNVQIYNMLGSVVMTRNSDNEELILDISSFSGGIYVASLFTDNGLIINKKFLMIR